MNRRQFFSFAAVAPVALPIAAKAMAERAPFARGGVLKYSGGVVGEVLSVSADGGLLVPRPYSDAILRMNTDGNAAALIERIKIRATSRKRVAADGVAQQMADDDLFELNCQGDGTLESTSDTLT